MFKLFCELKHDNGTIETVSVGCEPSDWETAFNWLVDVHCRDANTVELAPSFIATDLSDDEPDYVFFPGEFAAIDIEDFLDD